MDRGIITINETGVVTIPIAPIWMTKFEIAEPVRGVLMQCPQGNSFHLQEQGTERT